jgi:hypothetical protein
MARSRPEPMHDTIHQRQHRLIAATMHVNIIPNVRNESLRCRRKIPKWCLSLTATLMTAYSVETKSQTAMFPSAGGADGLISTAIGTLSMSSGGALGAPSSAPALILSTDPSLLFKLSRVRLLRVRFSRTIEPLRQCMRQTRCAYVACCPAFACALRASLVHARFLPVNTTENIPMQRAQESALQLCA